MSAFDSAKEKTIAWSLYAILDKKFIGSRNLKELTEQIIAGGARIIQLRNKLTSANEFYTDAVVVKEITDRHRVPLIINDRVDIALAVKADGVHLGQDDLPFEYARRLVGNEMLLGASVHDMLEFETARTGQPDYLGVGTIYPSQIKSDLTAKGIRLIQELRELTDLPMVGIGGITVENLAAVIEAGADGVAVISALLDTDDVFARTKEFVTRIRALKTSIQSPTS
jgi:thiamine-phosphate pyrophosphorylase